MDMQDYRNYKGDLNDKVPDSREISVSVLALVIPLLPIIVLAEGLMPILKRYA